jgi:hypothetical protein
MPDSDRDTLARDVTFDLLSNPRRRYILSYLHRVDGPVTLQDLAAEVAAWETDTPVDDLSRQERKRVYVSIYQTHVPKLDDAGVVEWDEDAGTVELAARGRDLSTYLARDADRREWTRYYLAAAVAGGLLYLALALGLPAVPGAVAVALTVAAFAAIAAAQLWSARQAPALEPRR